MSNELDDTLKSTEEVAKAASEVAKATGKAIDASMGLGGFFREVFGDLIVDSVGLAGDWMKSYREERLLILAERTRRRLAERGVSKTESVPPKVAVPLLEKASLEDDDDILDMWANLLANSLDPTSETPPQKYFVDILSQIGPAEAGLLHVLWLHSNLRSSSNLLDQEPTKQVVAIIEEEKETRWRHFPVALQRHAVHNLLRLDLAKFNVLGISTFSLTNKIMPLNTGQNVMASYDRSRSDEARELASVIQRMERAISVSSGSLEPDSFLSPSSSGIGKYRDPEKGMHLAVGGMLFMAACTNGDDAAELG